MSHYHLQKKCGNPHGFHVVKKFQFLKLLQWWSISWDQVHVYIPRAIFLFIHWWLKLVEKLTVPSGIKSILKFILKIAIHLLYYMYKCHTVNQWCIFFQSSALLYASNWIFVSFISLTAPLSFSKLILGTIKTASLIQSATSMQIQWLFSDCQ